MKKLIRIILSITISLLLSIVVFYNTTYDGLVAKIFGFGILEIQSGSMEKALSIGDIIIIKDSENYEVNDIVTFKVDNDYLVTHRIIERNGNIFKTKGDNNNTADEHKITKDKIEGKVIYNSKSLKWLYNHWILVVLVIFLFLIIL